MAIFGNLSEMPLGEFLPVLKVNRGALDLFALEQLPPATLYFAEAKLRCAKVGNVWADAFKAQSVVAHLLQAQRGSFEYLPGVEPQGCSEELWIPLDRLLLATVTIQDEVRNARRSLPHPDTRFKLKKTTPPGDPELMELWRRSAPLLAKGASARELSRELGINLELARLSLLKLKLSDRVQLYVAENERNSAVRSRRGTASKLLALLRLRFRGGK